MKKKLSLLIFITVDILIVLAVILITFRTTKDYYTVQFELNGGILLSGELKQTVKVKMVKSSLNGAMITLKLPKIKSFMLYGIMNQHLV